MQSQPESEYLKPRSISLFRRQIGLLPIATPFRAILANELLDSRYKDQDALNVHFRDQWHPLDLKWNAQGLGTYADSPSLDRDTLDLEGMKDG